MKSNDIHQSIIGSLISDNALYYRHMQDYVSVEYMERDDLIELTESIITEIQSGRKVDAIKAKALNPKYENLITSCILKSDAVSFDMYLNELIVRYKQRQLTNVLSDGILHIQNGEDPDEITVQVNEQLSHIAASKTINEVTYRQVVENVAIAIIDRKSSGLKLSGIDTGYIDLNKITDGFQKGDFVVTAGRPGMGKTSEALIRAYKMSKLGSVVLFFSLEMDTSSLLMRLYAYELGIAVNQLRRGEITTKQEAELHQISERIVNSTLRIIDNVRNIDGITSFCTLFNAQKKIDFIVVDYLQIVKNNHQNELRLKVTDNCVRLVELAKYLKCPINGLAQISRTGAGVTAPTIGHLKESGGIEETADLIALLHREGYYDPELGDEAQIIIAKNRNGETGIIYRTFDYPYLEYKENLSKFEAVKTTEATTDFNQLPALKSYRQIVTDESELKF